MPISQSDQLFNLVKSLTKAEKRNFSIYTSRFHDTDSMKYIQLFELLDKQNVLDESAISKKFPKGQLSNLKRHLYSQILISLRLIHKKKSSHIEIRELMDFANILYRKGLYLQALKILDKAIVLAMKIHDDLTQLNIIEFQKVIESRHITRTGTSKTRELLNLSEEKLIASGNLVKLTNLKIYLHGLYIKNGHIKSDKEHAEITKKFEQSLANIDIGNLNPNEKVHLYQSFVWYYYIIIDFINCYSYSLKWVTTLLDRDDSEPRDPNLLMRGYHYVLTSAFNTGDIDNYLKYLDELEKYRKSNYKRFDTNTQILSFLYVHHGRINKYFLLGDFEKGLSVIPRTLKRINKYSGKLDVHRIMVFYFKIAWMYFGAGKYSMCLKYLNKIMTMEVGILREDIQIYTRLMHLMAHFELENYNIGEYLVNSVDNFFQKIEGINSLQVKTLAFFKKINKLPISERLAVFDEFEKELIMLYHNKYEGKAFLYLDILSWVKSKTMRKPLPFIIKEKISS